MSNPPPKRVPQELNKSLNLTNYFKSLTDALYFLWSDVVDGRFIVKEYTVSSLPTDGKTTIARVTNETGGYTLAFWDGTNWRRVQDRAIVS